MYGDDAQVVLPAQFNPDVGGSSGLIRFIGGGDIRRKKGAVRIEIVRQTIHRAFHRLLDVHFLDVVVQDERDDVFEHAQVLIGLVFRHDLAEITANDGESDHRGGDEKHPETRA